MSEILYSLVPRNMSGGPKKKDDSDEKIDPKYPFSVSVNLRVLEKGKEIDSRRIDFGKLDKKGLDELLTLFSIMEQNIEQMKKMEPVFEKHDRTKPGYVG